MWFLIALMAYFLVVYVVTKAVVRSQGGIHHVGLQHAEDVSFSGGWSGTDDATSGSSGAGSGWSDVGDGGWGGGDGGGW